MSLASWRAGAPLAEVGEHKVLSCLRAALVRAWPARPASPDSLGDDAARISSLRDAIVSTDMMVEDVDFRRRWARPSDVGHKAAEANLSDLAAMGARPRALLASVAAPQHIGLTALLALLTTLDARGRAVGAPLVGGDLSATAGPITVSVTAVGQTAGSLLTRRSARLGDLVCVARPLGAAACGLAWLESKPSRRQRANGQSRQMVRAQLRPEAELALGRALAARGTASACADLSDGLASDVLSLVPTTLGVALDVARLPLARGLAACAHALTGPQQKVASPAKRAREAAAERQALQWALFGGEDFGLVFAVPRARWRRARALGAALHKTVVAIGWVVDAPGLTLWPSQTTVGAGGFRHFVGTPGR